MAKEFEEAYTKYLEWNRENNGRLYYVLWILFLGGFVYTLQLRPVAGCMQQGGIGLFRVLAIVGSVLNFFYQENAIDSLGKLREQLLQDDKHKWCVEHRSADGRIALHEQHAAECVNEPHYLKARSDECDVKRLDRRGICLQLSLRIVTCFYLVLALGLSFLLFPI